ncbi:MAG: hypothetical protein P8182_00855 [Deltaproteobacteria bacterium]
MPSKTRFSTKILIVASILLSVGYVRDLRAAGPRKESAPTCPRYSLPASVLEKPFRFAGEVIPFQRRDVRARVRAQLNFLLLDARSVLTTWLIEKNRYAWLFEEVFEKQGIPKDFILLAPVLSSLSVRSSPRWPGAGWWALEKPCDASDGVAMSKDSWHDDRLDLERSTRCFASRLKTIRKELGVKSWLTTAAAYVTSEKAVAKLGTQWNTLKYWDLPLPENAEVLVVRWIALGVIDANKSAFGIRVVAAPPLTYDQITGLILAKDLPVSVIARMTDAPPRQIIQLNPKLKRSPGQFPAKAGGKRIVHSLAAPKGKGWTLVNKLRKNGYLLEKQKH